MNPLKRIAAINDLSGLGKCSLTVALPIISASGVECSVIPTALLSTHTGVFKNWTLTDLTDMIQPVAEHWHSEGAVFDGIFTGYLASPQQGEVVSASIDLLRNENTIIIVDPAMADNGRYYSNLDDGMTLCFRDLFKKANVITPNFTEACFLSGMPYMDGAVPESYVDEMLDRLLDLGPQTVVVTGVSVKKDSIGTFLKNRTDHELHEIVANEKTGMFHGAGDVFASSLSALLVRGASEEDAVKIAMEFTSDCIDRTEKRGTPRHYGLDFESALPGYITQLDNYFKD